MATMNPLYRLCIERKRGERTMQKQYSTKKISTSSHHFQLCLTWVLTLAALMFFVFGVFLTFALSLQADTDSSLSKSMSRQTGISTPTADTRLSSGTTPVTNLGLPSNQTSSSGSTATATPSLIPSTPQPTQLGVFSLSSGGPLPVPETVLHPTNIARVMLNTTLISVYAGSMTQNP
jgi:hypothetical protein